METIATKEDMGESTDGATLSGSWARVLRDVLVFQFKLVVDGLKDLCLAQVAVGAAVVDLVRRDGSPGRRFYAVVRLSDRFDGWLDLHEPLARLPEDAPQYAPPPRHSVDDILDGIETSARVVADASVSASTRGLDLVRRETQRRRTSRVRAVGEALESA